MSIEDVIASLDRVCPACLAADSDQTWWLLHEGRTCATIAARRGILNAMQDSRLRVVSLTDRLWPHASDALRALPVVDAFLPEHMFTIVRVLPLEPSEDEVRELAVSLSNLLEDVSTFSRGMSPHQVVTFCPPMGIPILDREESRGMCPHDMAFNSVVVKKRELACVLYLVTPEWRGWERPGTLARLDEMARRHGLRCVDVGVVPPDDDAPRST